MRYLTCVQREERVGYRGREDCSMYTTCACQAVLEAGRRKLLGFQVLEMGNQPAPRCKAWRTLMLFSMSLT